MSYDIRYGIESRYPDLSGDSMVVIGAPTYDNPTYNLRDMFVACMDWNYKQGVWYPMAEVLPKLRHGLAQLVKHPEKYRQYEPENGWGTLNGAIKCIESWIDELTNEDNWDSVCHYWPLDALWWRW